MDKKIKIDAVEFSKMMAIVNNTTVSDELKSLLDWLGVKYTDQSKK